MSDSKSASGSEPGSATNSQTGSAKSRSSSIKGSQSGASSPQSPSGGGSGAGSGANSPPKSPSAGGSGASSPKSPAAQKSRTSSARSDASAAPSAGSKSRSSSAKSEASAGSEASKSRGSLSRGSKSRASSGKSVSFPDEVSKGEGSTKSIAGSQSGSRASSAKSEAGSASGSAAESAAESGAESSPESKESISGSKSGSAKSDKSAASESGSKESESGSRSGSAKSDKTAASGSKSESGSRSGSAKSDKTAESGSKSESGSRSGSAKSDASGAKSAKSGSVAGSAASARSSAAASAAKSERSGSQAGSKPPTGKSSAKATPAESRNSTPGSKSLGDYDEYYVVADKSASDVEDGAQQKSEGERKDSVRKDSVKGERKDSVKFERKDSERKDSVKGERKDSVRKDSVKGEGERKDSMKGERKDSVRKDSVKGEGERKDSVKKDSERKDSIKKDSERKESVKKESAPEESSPKGSPKPKKAAPKKKPPKPQPKQESPESQPSSQSPGGVKRKKIDIRKRPKWYRELDDEQLKMFTALYQILDHEGNGTVTPGAVMRAMETLEIGITSEEVGEQFDEIGRRPKQEITYDEYLYVMAQTNKKLAEGDSDERGGEHWSKRIKSYQRLSGRRKSEVQRYEKKRRSSPQVLDLYKIGVQLYGMNNSQITRTMIALKKSMKGQHINSPYAEVLPFVCVDLQSEVKQRKAKHVDTRQSSRLSSKLSTKRFDHTPGRESKIMDRCGIPPARKKRPAWKMPPIERRRVPLPILKNIALPHNRQITIEDNWWLRDYVGTLMGNYYARLKKEHVRTAKKHWEAIEPETIPSYHLRQVFLQAFQTYSPFDEDQVQAWCPWVPTGDVKNFEGPSYGSNDPYSTRFLARVARNHKMYGHLFRKPNIGPVREFGVPMRRPGKAIVQGRLM